MLRSWQVDLPTAIPRRSAAACPAASLPIGRKRRTVRQRRPAHFIRRRGMPGIQANGSVFEYRESGSGTPVVFVHGAVNDHRTWEGQIDSFSRRYRVVAYSRRFHYPNPWPGDDVSYSLSLHADDLAALI